MSENDLIEMADDCKNRIQEKNRELYFLKKKNHEIMKELITCYGIVRVLDNLLEQVEVESEIKNISDVLRTHLSDLFDKIFSYSIEDE